MKFEYRDRYVLKKLQMKPFNCIEQVIADEQLCMLMNGNICNFHFQISKLSLFKWLKLCYLLTYSFNFGIKTKKTPTSFLWYTFNCPNMKHFWENCPGTFFCWVYNMVLLNSILWSTASSFLKQIWDFIPVEASAIMFE